MTDTDTDVVAGHQLAHRAMSNGLSDLGVLDNDRAYWFCTCGSWTLPRNDRGSPFRQTAEKFHRRHVNTVMHEKNHPDDRQ